MSQAFTGTATSGDDGGKDYAAESAALVALAREMAPHARTLLDVACGSGGHLRSLSKVFACEGVDIDPQAIAAARVAAPGVPLHVADMETLSLGRRFDVVTCLFSSIAYVETVARLRNTVARLAAHVEPGGLLIVEPWALPETWLGAGPDAGETTEDAVAAVPPVLRGQAVVEMMAGGKASVGRLRDMPTLGWFTFSEYDGALKVSGIECRHMGYGLSGRGLFLGMKERCETR